MRLILVESPTKSRTISQFLGKEYQISATFGHVRDLPKSEFGIDTEQDFKPKYVIPLKARKTIGLLKKEIKKADSIILATDEDREGEAIAWHVVQVLGLDEQNTHRIVFHEITKPAIETALKNPRQIDMNLVDAQQARRILDRIVGYKLSPFLWKKIARRLSAGRVQSAAVKLICDREEEIKNFIPQEYWSIEAEFRKIQNSKFAGCGADSPKSCIRNKSQILNSKFQTEFKASLIKKDDEIIPKLGIKTKKSADEIVKDLNEAEYKIINIEKKEVKKNPAPPFITSFLQQEAWQKFHWPARLTMGVAQSLYENGLISYHRTDSLNLSEQSLAAAKNFIETNYGKNYSAGFFRKFKTKSKGAQEAHEAIRPANPNFAPQNLGGQTKEQTNFKTKNEEKLYDLIWRRFIASQMSQASFNSTIVEIEAGNPKSETRNPKPHTNPFGILRGRQIQNSNVQNSKYTFRTSGQMLKFDGFLKVYPIKYKETELPILGKDEILELIKLMPLQHFTEPLARYTEASLIKVLEENGIGRPSTYAPILFVIQARNYVEKNEDKRFQPTEIGVAVNDVLTIHFPKIVDIGFTAQMEEDLDKIAQGGKNWTEALKEFYKPFEENLLKKYQEVSKKEIAEEITEEKCPQCGANLLIKLGRFGKFLACPNFPKCKFAKSIKKSEINVKCPRCSIRMAQSPSLRSGHYSKTPIRMGEIVEKMTRLRQGFGGRKKFFYGCSNWPECDFALWDKPTGKFCSKCDSMIVVTKKGEKCSSCGKSKIKNCAVAKTTIACRRQKSKVSPR
jgi:DNA topoisomerase-1